MYRGSNTANKTIITLISIDVNYGGKGCFMVNLKGYKSIEIYFMEIENYIQEFDEKLYKYLLQFKTIREKISEAISIGYDFEDLISDYIKNLIEYGLITLSIDSKI